MHAVMPPSREPLLERMESPQGCRYSMASAGHQYSDLNVNDRHMKWPYTSHNETRGLSMQRSPVTPAHDDILVPFPELHVPQRSPEPSPPPQYMSEYGEHDNINYDGSIGSMVSLEPSGADLRITCDGRTEVVTVDRMWTAHDVCETLIHRCGHIKDKNWVLIESLESLSFERIVEDHERIMEFYNDSPSLRATFKFVKDFRKYDVFHDPTAYLPLKMLVFNNEGKGDTDPRDQKKQLLMGLRDKIVRLPQIQGHLHYRLNGKWKKMYFVIKKNGLHRCKNGTSTETKNMVFVSNFLGLDIYRCNNMKKVYGGPTSFGIILKSRGKLTDTRGSNMTLFCADTEQTRLCFLTAFRLVKHGDEMSESFHQAKEREGEVYQSSNARSPTSERSNGRVPMDFSGNVGRVVSTPQEYAAVKIYEHQHIRKRYAERLPASPASTPPTGASFLSEMKADKYGLGSGIHMTQPWFHSGRTRQEATDLITSYGCENGLYLLRESQSFEGEYVISMAYDFSVLHLRIHRVESNGRLYVSLDRTTNFTDLIQLLDFYKINSASLKTPLTHYVSNTRKGSL